MFRRPIVPLAAILVGWPAAPPVAAQPEPVKELPLDPKGQARSSAVAWMGFSPDGQHFAVRDYPGTGRVDRVRVWSVPGWRQTRSWEAGLSPGRIADCPCLFHPDGRLLYVDGGNVRVRDPDGKPARPDVVLESPEYNQSGWGFPYSFLWLADDGKRCLRASVYAYGVTVDRWDLAEPKRGRRVLQYEEMKFDFIDAAAFDPVRGRLATYNQSETVGIARAVRVWELPAKKDLGALKHPVNVTAIAFGPEGESIAVGYAQRDAAVRVWDAKTGRMRSDYRAPLRAGCLAVSPDGKQLAVGGEDKDRVGRACLLDAATGKVLAEWAAAPGSVERVCFSTTGDLLATSGGDSVVRLWDVDKLTGKKGR
jgi:WD40 repeat protein